MSELAIKLLNNIWLIENDNSQLKKYFRERCVRAWADKIIQAGV